MGNLRQDGSYYSGGYYRKITTHKLACGAVIKVEDRGPSVPYSVTITNTPCLYVDRFTGKDGETSNVTININHSVLAELPDLIKKVQHG